MMIQILVTGCSKCRYLFQAAEQAVKESGVSATVETVTDVSQVLEYSPWALPALAIDGQARHDRRRGQGALSRVRRYGHDMVRRLTPAR